MKSHVLHRNSNLNYPAVVSGDGCWLIDRDGKRYFDGSSGAAVSCLGYNHPRIIEAIRQQIERIAYAHSSFFTNEPMEALASYLVETAPQGITKVYFASGGSEAVEAAIKLARQYFVEIGQPEKQKLIARLQSYHGNTLGALAASGNAARRSAFAPLLTETHFISPCSPYRNRLDNESHEAYGLRAANELETKILELGPKNVMGFIAETVMGATAGAVPPVAGYLKRIREICDRHGVLLILDEVMCGMGRTGTLHACTRYGIAPDLMAIAKGLGGGYQPIGAVLIAEKIEAAIRHGSGTFVNAHTYNGHATACAAALAVQQVIRDEDLLRNVRERGEQLRSSLEERFRDHGHVGDIRGIGLLQAVEIVQDRKTKQPFDPELKIHARVRKEAMDRGLCIYPLGGTVDGRKGDHVVIAPPYIVKSEEIELLVDRLAGAMKVL